MVGTVKCGVTGWCLRKGQWLQGWRKRGRERPEGERLQEGGEGEIRGLRGESDREMTTICHFNLFNERVSRIRGDEGKGQWRCSGSVYRKERGESESATGR